MKTKSLLLIIVSFLIFIGNMNAQVTPAKPAPKSPAAPKVRKVPQKWVQVDSLHDYCWLCHDYQHLIGSPYNHTLKKEWPILLSAGAILTAGLIINNTDPTKPFTEAQLSGLNRNQVNAFDRIATNNWSPTSQTISDYSLIGISLLPVLFLGEHHTGQDFRSLGIMTLEVFAVNYGLTYIVKCTVNRTRPYVYNTSLPVETRTDGESRRSYYSGHTSQTAAATFLFAKVISDYHNLSTGAKIGLWSFAAAVPAFEGYFRVAGGKHYPTDVITGYVLGAFSGFIVPELHRNHTYRPHKAKLDVGFVPDFRGGMMANLNLKF